MIKMPFFLRLIVILSLPLTLCAAVLVALMPGMTALYDDVIVYAYDDGFTTQSIRLLDVRLRQHHTLIDFVGTDFYPSWSPAGEQVAFSSMLAGDGMDIYTTPAIGRTLTRMTDSQRAKFGVRWSPDGTKIAWVEFDATTQAVFVLDVATLQVTQISDWWNIRLEGFAWSPDSRYLSVLASPSETFAPIAQLYIVPVAANAPQLLYDDNPVLDASWSADGAQIAIVAGDAILGQGRVYIVDADTGAVTALDDTLLARRVSWSPDGATLALTAYLRTRFHILLYDVASSTMTEPLPLQPVLSASPLAWSPDSARLVFAFGRGLHLLNIQRGTVQQLTDNMPIGSVAARFEFRP